MSFFEQIKTLSDQLSQGVIQIPFVQKVFSDTIPEEAKKDFRKQFIDFYIQYYYWVKSVSPFLSSAAGRIPDEYRTIRDWFYKTAFYEYNHYDFIMNDLIEMGVSESTIKKTKPNPAMDALIGYNHYFPYHHHPVGVIGTPLIMGGLSNQLSLKVADGLEKKLGARLSFFDAHGHLDKDQPEDIAQILKTITDPTVHEAILFNIQTINMLYIHFLKSL